MKYLLFCIFSLGSIFSINAQDRIVLETGTVSFISTKNVYVKFKNTKFINLGDSLFIDQAGVLIPVLVVENKSSSSTVCKVIGNKSVKTKVAIIARTIIPEEKPKVEEQSKEVVTTIPDVVINNDPVIKAEDDQVEEDVLFKEKIKGRISAASYSNVSNYANRHRMRYAFSLRAYNIKNSRFSTEGYITFRHTLNDSTSFAEALKVYNLNVKYEFSKNTHLTFGRKINLKFSSMGAIDGLQFQKGWGAFSAGLIVGTRPDFRDYSLNTNLLQYGAYASYGSLNPAKFAQTTLGFIEQTNQGKTDRRFLYFQHSSTLAKNLNFFGSMEVDLFANVDSVVTNTAQLTNLYASLRYRFSKKFRVSISYDTRKNIIYYESYKNFIDQLIDDETRQGLRFGLSHRVSKKISWGANVNIRFQQSQRNPARNVSGYINYNNIPFIKARVNLRASFLQTDYIQSQVFGARLSKEFIRGRLSGDLYYRWVDYKYLMADRVVHQNIAGASLSIRIQKQLSLHLFYEGVQDNSKNKIQYNRVNVKLIKRF